MQNLVIAALVLLVVQSADLANQPVILLEADQQKPVADETPIFSAEISMAQEIYDDADAAIDYMEKLAKAEIDEFENLLLINKYPKLRYLLAEIYTLLGGIIAFLGAN